MKEGRGRLYPAFGGMGKELAFLKELHARAQDLVEDLPTEAWDEEMHGHTIRQLWEHLIWGEALWASRVAGVEVDEPIKDIAALEEYSQNVFSGIALGTEMEVGPFTCVDQVIRHLEWHWSYHSAQIGLLRRGLGQKYKWTFGK